MLCLKHRYSRAVLPERKCINIFFLLFSKCFYSNWQSMMVYQCYLCFKLFLIIVGKYIANPFDWRHSQHYRRTGPFLLTCWEQLIYYITIYHMLAIINIYIFTIYFMMIISKFDSYMGLFRLYFSPKVCFYEGVWSVLGCWCAAAWTDG